MDALINIISPVWLWFGLACLLLAVEVLIAPSGFFLCCGTAAAIVAFTVFLFPAMPWLWSLSFFALLLIIACYVWWKLLRHKFGAHRETPADMLNVKPRQLVGYRAALAEPIKAGRGRLKVNDSPWPVEAEIDYPAGTLVEVTEVKGITLKVKAAGEQHMRE